MCEETPEVKYTGKCQPEDKTYGKDRHRKKGINMHKLGEVFVGEFLKVRKGTSREDRLGKGPEFLARGCI